MTCDVSPASVIIAVSRPGPSLERCLASLAAQRPRPPREVVLVGDVPPEFTWPGLEVVAVGEEETSASLRRNRGVAASRGEILCFVDDDVQVPPHWLATIEQVLARHPRDLVGGPNLDHRRHFPYRLAAAVQASFLSEGLVSHRSHKEQDLREVGIHDLPLCNLAMTRATFQAVGGFNQEVPYFLDDVEFHYIARGQGRRLLMHPELEVQHDARPFWMPYLAYKLRTRWQIGWVLPVYHRLYGDTFQVKALLASYPLLAWGLGWGGGWFWGGLLSVYLAALGAAAWPWRSEPRMAAGVAAGVALTHLVSYAGFTAGLAWGLVCYPRLRRLIPQRERRFARRG